jgi:hypothetical protein
MAKFKEGDLVLTATQKIIQGTETILDENGVAKFSSLALNSSIIIDDITDDITLSSDSTSTLVSERAIKSYVDNSLGVSGTSGSSGTSGVQGLSGTSGTSGISGTSGTSGTSITSYLYEQPFDSTSWNVIHNLSSKYVVVQVFDETDKAIIPSEIICVDSSSLIITFIEAEQGHAKVIG